MALRSAVRPGSPRQVVSGYVGCSPKTSDYQQATRHAVAVWSKSSARLLGLRSVPGSQRLPRLRQGVGPQVRGARQGARQTLGVFEDLQGASKGATWTKRG